MATRLRMDATGRCEKQYDKDEPQDTERRLRTRRSDGFLRIH